MSATINIHGCGLGPDAKTVQDVMQCMARIVPHAKWTLIEAADGSSEIMGVCEGAPTIVLEFPASVGNRWTNSNPEGT